MAKTKAYTRHIYKNTKDSHQTSPGYVVTFIRWDNRDTMNYEEDVLETRKPLVVINDCVELQVTNTKQAITSSFSGKFKAGDLNYSTAVHPGDYVLINMVNQEDKAWNIYERALAAKPINEFDDGFKGLFKVQTVRRRIEVDPQTGVKQYYFVIHGFGFSEMKTQMYYDPVISTMFQKSDVLFLSQFSKHWSDLSSSYKNKQNVQTVMIILFKLLLGTGLNNKDFQIPPSQNAHFKVPSLVAKLLGRTAIGSSEKVIPDIYNFSFGIWPNKSSGFEEKGNENKGFNPGSSKNEGDANFFNVGGEMEGWRILGADNFNQKEIWTVMQSYLNGAINEMYTTYRVSPDDDRRVYPTVVVRQKPFSSEHYLTPKETIAPLKDLQPKAYTKFMSIPRWKISSDLMYSVDLGKDESARINFVQLYGRSIAASDKENRAGQIGRGNFFYDTEDIKRHGLKPFVTTSSFDFPSAAGGNDLQARHWAYLLFDMLNAGQLRESGSISTVGIQHPISVGDNLEFDDSVYHIEQTTHVMKIDAGGRKTFRTNLLLSFGTHIDSSNTTPVYPQMKHTDSYRERIRDNVNEQILPGVGDTQDIGGRVKGEELKETKEKSFTGTGVKETGMDRLGSLTKDHDEKDE